MTNKYENLDWEETLILINKTASQLGIESSDPHYKHFHCGYLKGVIEKLTMLAEHVKAIEDADDAAKAASKQGMKGIIRAIQEFEGKT